MTTIQMLFLILAVATGIVIGWFGRGRRARQEKAAINAGWKEQFDAQRIEQKRLLQQSKGLMEQVSQHQASDKDASNRARELSSALKEAFERRDHLQRELKEMRSKLESALAERLRLESDMEALAAAEGARASAVQEKDEKIFKLSRELDSWHERLPPLLERFKDRDAEVRRLRTELESAETRISELEERLATDETRAEPVDAERMAAALDASNDANGEDTRPRDYSNGAGRDSAWAATAGGRAGHDDLKEIKGVGPAIEKTLHELGFFSFGQIAELSEYDIDRIARRLRGFRSRIYREDWIGQARALQHGYSVEEPF